MKLSFDYLIFEPRSDYWLKALPCKVTFCSCSDLNFVPLADEILLLIFMLMLASQCFDFREPLWLKKGLLIKKLFFIKR